jgi:hypothetical protein
MQRGLTVGRVERHHVCAEFQQLFDDLHIASQTCEVQRGPAAPGILCVCVCVCVLCVCLSVCLRWSRVCFVCVCWGLCVCVFVVCVPPLARPLARPCLYVRVFVRPGARVVFACGVRAGVRGSASGRCMLSHKALGFRL